MSYLFYKWLHVVSLLAVSGSLLALLFLASPSREKPLRFRTLALFHGFGLLGLLVSGFGLLAKLGISGVPSWVTLKIGIWMILGGYLALIKRMGFLAFWPLVLGLFSFLGTGIYLALFHSVSM
jgi:hypothetical protein